MCSVFYWLLQCWVLGDGFLQGSYGYTCICGSYFLSQVIFIFLLFQLHSHTLPYPKTKGKQKLPEVYKKSTTKYT